MQTNPTEKNNTSFYERLVLNNQKGEIYKMKLKSSPLIFLAIPVQREGITGTGNNMFSYKIIEPEEYRGNYKGLIDDIDFMEKMTV